jgi:8-oxo-dGTP diphosphatase
MWLITNFGFFSVVQKPGDKAAGELTVRSRVRSDLETLRDRYLPQLGEIKANAGTDYKYRAKVPREALAAAAGQIVRDIAYTNFKDSVAKQQGHKRAKTYHQLWDVLFQLQDNEQDFSQSSSSKAAKATHAEKGLKLAYGGVLFDAQGRVLLRKPKGEFGGYAWTFAKGRPEPGDTPEDTARREVREETGYDAEIIGRIPGSFEGDTTSNEFFLMRPVGEPQAFGWETQVIEWVPIDQAAGYLKRTRNAVGRKRDLAVLKAAVGEYNRVGKRWNRKTVNRKTGH